jgi:hypothetical protein
LDIYFNNTDPRNPVSIGYTVEIPLLTVLGDYRITLALLGPDTNLTLISQGLDTNLQLEDGFFQFAATGKILPLNETMSFDSLHLDFKSKSLGWTGKTLKKLVLSLHNYLECCPRSFVGKFYNSLILFYSKLAHRT